jgi:penicillin-insensitive murein endopeptidase
VAKRTPLPAPPPRPESVGHPNEGRLEGGVRLDTSRPYLRVVPSHERRDARWGLPALVGMIDRAARAVAKRYPGAALNVGDLSLRGGGELLRHNSHESGRDADLGFYVVDAAGQSVHARTFVQFDETLKSSAAGGARFDLGRNWLLVQHLVTDPVAQVSHIFVAEPLRKRLLAHARSIGVSQRILDRAAIAMMQPSNSLPHDDHFHVRISCPRSMRGTCIELAKETRRGGSRVAHRRRGGAGRGVLKTPASARASAATAGSHMKGTAPAGQGARSKLREATLRGAKGGSEPAAAAPAAPDPSEQTSRLSLVPDHDEADADAAEVKDAIDESGALKITD